MSRRIFLQTEATIKNIERISVPDEYRLFKQHSPQICLWDGTKMS